MIDSLRVAARTVASQPGRTSENVDRIAEYIHGDAELFLFPELSITGFIPNHPESNHERWLREALAFARSIAEPLDGPAVQSLKALARSRNIFIAAGLLEDAGNTLYNTHVLIGPEGLAGAWRKMHIPMFEMPFYNGGPAPKVADTPLGRIGVNICFDALIPESTRLLAVQNAEIVLFPFAADPAHGWAEWARVALQSRCQENGVFGVAVNYEGAVEACGVSQRFPGGSLCIGPRGDVIGEHQSVYEIRREDLQAARGEPEYLYRFRRPELYGPLAMPSHETD
ncbi:MAG: carbon-nitrogen hydrolase family protein [Acidobacteria bacterium]|nr:carbon-nitrogen hydrolase family protein [Acidobacteriota bacterium]